MLGILFHPSPWLGMSFIALVLFVGVFTNVRARGVYSFMLIFVAIAAPNLVSADLRNHTLPLYFARPIRRLDYPLAKLIAFLLDCPAG